MEENNQSVRWVDFEEVSYRYIQRNIFGISVISAITEMEKELENPDSYLHKHITKEQLEAAKRFINKQENGK